jgi:hypothetical protein
MKITTTSDWRQSIAFDAPVLVADVVPGEPTRCFVCGSSSEPRPRTELWAIKHRHPNDHAGYVRFYCREHLPAIQARPAEETRAKPAAAPRARRAPAQRSTATAPSDRVRAMCPDCYVEISATGVCGMCGRQVG